MSFEERKLDFQLTRSPLEDVDVTDTGAVREWMLLRTEARIRNEGRLKARFRYLTAEKEEAYDVADAEPGEEAFHALFFRQLGQRPEIVRRFREGELRLDTEDGLRRVAVILEHVPEGDQWWLAWRLTGEREGSVGVFHGDWVIAEGTGADVLPEGFREWLQRFEVSHARLEEKPAVVPMPEMLFGSLQMEEAVPEDPVGVVDRVGRLTDGNILRDGFPGPQILAFRGLTAELFVLRGKLGCPVDDLIRHIALQGEIDAIAFMLPGVVKVDGVDTRSLITIGEAKDGRRGQRIMPLRWNPDGSVSVPQVWMHEIPAAEPEKRWIGVKPTTEISMFPMAPEGGVVAEG